jgi:hypothetical protein
MNKILSISKEWTRKLELENINKVDTSDSKYYTNIFYKAFPKMAGSYIFHFQGYKKIKPLDLNYILEHFALLQNIKFNNKYPNKNLLKNFKGKIYLSNYQKLSQSDDTPLSVIFALAENEYQAWLTTFYLFMKIPSILAKNIIHSCFLILNSDIDKPWIEHLANYNREFLNDFIILPEERYKENVHSCYSPIPRYEIIYTQVLNFVIMMNYDFFSFYIKTSASSSLYRLFIFNDKRNEFIEKLISTSIPEINFNLLFFTFGELTEKQTNLIFKSLNKDEKYLKNGFVLMEAVDLNKKYNCKELEKYLANRLLIELKE